MSTSAARSGAEGEDNQLVEKLRSELEELNQLALESTGKGGKSKEFHLDDIDSSLPALASVFKETHCGELHQKALLVLKCLLACRPSRVRKERSKLVLANRPLLVALLDFEDSVSHVASGAVTPNEDTVGELELLYTVLGRISTSDERYGTKLRSVNSKAVLVPLRQIQKWSRSKGSAKILVAVMGYLKHVCTSCTNVSALVWGSNSSSKSSYADGIVSPLFQIICTHKFSTMASIQAIELLALILRSREGILSLIEPTTNSGGGYMGKLVALLKNNSKYIDSKYPLRGLRFVYALISCLLHVAYIRPGRQTLIKTDVLNLVHLFAKKLVQMKEHVPQAHRTLLLCSILIQRCLEPMKLPLNLEEHSMTSNIPGDLLELTKKSSENGSKQIYADEYFCSSDGSDAEEDEAEIMSLKCSCDPLDDSFEKDADGDISSYAQFFPEMNRCAVSNSSSSPMSIAGSASKLNAKQSRSIADYLLCACANGERSLSSSPDLKSTEQLLKTLTVNETRAPLTFDELDEKSGIEAVDWIQAYTASCEKTKHLTGIEKTADWLLHEVKGSRHYYEPLDTEESDVWTTKLIEHINSRLFGEMRPLAVTVFDLDLNQPQIQRKGQGSLRFESRFESGNLRKAIQIGPSEYNLLLSPDIGTEGHCSWFYFEVGGMSTTAEYVFNIINCDKQSGLFNDGVRPLLYSTQENEEGHGHGWRRCGRRAAYFRNHYVSGDNLASLLNGNVYQTLTFTVSFPHEHDTCYLAYNYPYTNSLLQTHCHFWESSLLNSTSIFFEKQLLCKSLTGNELPVLTITSRQAMSKCVTNYILLMARVHPSETCASWMMKGSVEFLISDHPSAIKLRDKYVFKVIPMLNPDGVVHGSTRTSLSGDDLNRQWGKPSKLRHPEIYHAKNLVKHLVKGGGRKLLMVCDFHGHSRRKNIFLYGCSPSLSWKMSDRIEHGNKSGSKVQPEDVLPVILTQYAPAFSLRDSCFTIEKSRESTARITFWREFGVTASYTMEASQGACDQGSYAGNHLGLEQLQEMGAKFCEALVDLEFKTVDERTFPVLSDTLLTKLDNLITLVQDVDSCTSEEDDDLACDVDASL